MTDTKPLTLPLFRDQQSLGSFDVAHIVRKSLSEQIDKYFLAICDLRVRMNQHVPIARLPPEVLGHIFACLVAIMEEYLPGFGRLGSSPNYRWLSVTHVCHHWREVALRTPVLWTNISVQHSRSVERVEAFITRSRRAPLRVKVRVIQDIERWRGTLKLLAREMSRVEELELLVYETEDMWKDVAQHFPPAAPLLRTLVIRVDGIIEPAIYGALVRFLSQSAAPNLKGLEVLSFRISWNKTILPQSLTRIVVDYSRGEFGQESCSSVAVAIGNLPVLEELKLLYVLAPLQVDMQSLPPVKSPITLPRLRFLDISASALACVHFVDHLIIPGDAAIHLHFVDYPANAGSLLVPALSSKMMFSAESSEDLDHRQMIRAVSLERSKLVFCNHDDFFATEPSQYRLQIQFPSPMVESGVALSDLCSNLPLQNVSFLRARHITCKKETQLSWINMLNAMSGVQTVHFSSLAVQLGDVVALLRARTGASSGSPKQQTASRTFVLPNLKILILEEVRFKEAGEHSDGVFSCVYGLRKEINARENAGHELEKVIVKRCINMNDDDIEILEEAVTVDWDNQVEFEPSDDEDDEDLYDEEMEKDMQELNAWWGSYQDEEY